MNEESKLPKWATLIEKISKMRKQRGENNGRNNENESGST